MDKENFDLMVGDIFYKENKRFFLNSAFKRRKKEFIKVKINQSQDR
jgi:hypothetical protein